MLRILPGTDAPTVLCWKCLILSLSRFCFFFIFFSLISFILLFYLISRFFFLLNSSCFIFFFLTNYLYIFFFYWNGKQSTSKLLAFFVLIFIFILLFFFFLMFWTSFLFFQIYFILYNLFSWRKCYITSNTYLSLCLSMCWEFYTEVTPRVLHLSLVLACSIPLRQTLHSHSTCLLIWRLFPTHFF